MVLWNFDLLWKNYGTMEKTWYYTENYSTLIAKEKTYNITNNYETLIDNGKKIG